MIITFKKQLFTKFFKLALVTSLLILGISLFLLLFSSLSPLSQLATKTQAAANSSADAIAMRVVPNPEHYSAQRWYSQEQFHGSPQSLLVDGYEAVRDGRTVYVNAANINNNTFYTNIYIISYNQEAETATTDIFGQILSHWKFNTNITTSGFCSQTTTRACLNDYDCPAGDYCLSRKTKIVRDTKRLSDLVEIKIALDAYKNSPSRGYYPKLASGTYLPNKTISVWPSWQQTLAKELGVDLPTDPINKLVGCDGDYDKDTCWDEKIKRFKDENYSHIFGTSNTPDDHVFVYATLPSGSSYKLCAFMESGYINTLNGNCKEPIVSNNPPSINCSQPPAYSGQSFTGYVSASDPEGDAFINWSFSKSGDWSSWVGGPNNLENTPLPSQKKLSATKAGNVGTYNFTVSVTDAASQTATKNCSIIVK